MESKALLFGISGFILGGLVVSIAATTFEKSDNSNARTSPGYSTMSMEHMTASLADKEGDAYDQQFITSMIAHHASAVSMANLSPSRAKHNEIKQLSEDIIKAQEKEIQQMKQWQKEWGYYSGTKSHSAHGSM